MKKLLQKADSYLRAHNGVLCVLMFGVVLVSLATLGWFLLFSGLNTSADFVYNQF